MTRRTVTDREPVWLPVDVVDGESVIEVVGDTCASMLLLAGDAVAVGGSDGHGSIGMLAARARGPGVPTAAEVKSLTDWLADPGLRPGAGRTWSIPLHPPDPERLRPLLGLLRPGRYVMTAYVVHRPLVVGRTAWWCDHQELVLIPTDAWPPRHQATVRRYKDRIGRDAVWPAVITLSPEPGSEIAYILDGHHKLAAYLAAGLPPLLIRLAPERPFRPRNAEVRRARAAFMAGVASWPDGDRDETAVDVLSMLGELRDQSRTPESSADWLAEHGLHAEAEAEYRIDLDILRTAIAKESRSADPEALRIRLADVYHRYGALLLAMGRDAEQPLRSAWAMRSRLLGDDHPDTRQTRRLLGT